MTFPVLYSRRQYTPFEFVYNLPERNTRRRSEGKHFPAMAATDSGLKPLQNAMKMAKVAIQLDGDNKHKVVCFTA